jgi:DNA replication protein DnaC
MLSYRQVAHRPPKYSKSRTHWHEQIGDPTIADSILDRIVHDAYRIELNGESLRKKKGRKPEEGGES